MNDGTHPPRLNAAVTPVTDSGYQDPKGISNPEGDGIRYRLDVVAASVVDVIEGVGGWLFDRRMEGWDVTALMPGEADARALRILGVDTLSVGPAWSDWAERPRVQALAVSADLFDRDLRVRQGVLQMLEDGLPEVVLWGGDWPADLACLDGEVLHELSGAARVFKCHALRAAAGPALAAEDQVEVFQYRTIASPSPSARHRRHRQHLRRGHTV